MPFKTPKLTCFFCLLVLHVGVMAQVSKSVIKGTLKDSITTKPVGYVTVGLYKAAKPEKAIKNVFSSSKGEYQFNGVDTGNYTIIISGSGYTEKFIRDIAITNSTANIETGTVMLLTAPKELEGVTVSSTRKPLIEKSEDKIIFNAEADPTVDGQQATDVLRKTPFLSVDNDGNVTLNGQTNFKILLNGKESAMFSKDPKEVLKSFPASLIKRVEVITQPSAKYDAEGIGGIINIITKKSILGYNGNVNTNGSTMGNRNINTSINAKYGSWGFSGYAGTGGANNVPGSSESVTNNLDTSGSYRQRLLNGSTDRSWAWRTINSEITYDIDSLNSISVYANAGGGNDVDNLNQQSYLVLPQGDTTKGVLNTQGNDQYRWSDMGMDYIKKFSGAENKELTFRFNRQYDYENVISNSQQLQPGLERYVLTTNRSNNYQYTFQSDFTLPLKNKQKLEMGAKAILRRADADYEGQVAYTPGKYTPDTSNTNIFHYDQNIVAAYTTYGFNIKKTFFKLGVRGEWSTLGGDFGNGIATVQQNYFNLVPTVYISRNLPNNHTISLSYNIRLQRPYITDLDPFVDKSDSLNLHYGNPNLKPQTIHNVELGYSYFKGPNSVNIKLSGFYSNNKITQYAIFDGATGITDWTSDNIGRNYGSSLSGFVSLKPVKWWTLSSNLGLRYDFIVNKYDTRVSNQGLSGWSNFNSTFDINKILAAAGNIGMNQGTISLQQKPGMNYWYGLNGAIKLKNNKFRITLLLNNFLNDHVIKNTTNSGTDFNGYQKSFNTGKTIGLSLRWNFGKLTDNVSKKIGVNNDDLKK